MKNNIKILFGNEASRKQIKQAAAISEKAFKTKEDSSQMKSDYHLFMKIAKKFPKFFSIITLNNRVLGDNIMLPCKKQLMLDFLNDKLNEKELTNIILKENYNKNFDCLFLAEIVIDKKLRKRGYASILFNKSIDKIKKITNKKIPAFYWAWSKEGEFFTIKNLIKDNIDYYFKNKEI